MYDLDTSPSVLSVDVDLQFPPLPQGHLNCRRGWDQEGAPAAGLSDERVTLLLKAGRLPFDRESQTPGVLEMLADDGVEMIAVDSVPEALDLLRKRPFDLVLVGMDEPGDQAPDFLRQLRRLSPVMNCIVISATLGPEQERSLREQGVIAILDQPMPLRQLAETARRLAARKRSYAS